MPAGAASRYALGADGAGAARPAPATSLISASRYAPGARRTALRAEGAARLCARRSCWLPSPGLALRARCRGCGRCAPGRLRQSFRRLALRARRRRRGSCAPGRLHVAPPPPLMRALPLGGGDVEDVVRFTLLETPEHRRSAGRACDRRPEITFFCDRSEVLEALRSHGALDSCAWLLIWRKRWRTVGAELLPSQSDHADRASAQCFKPRASETTCAT